MKTVKAWQIDDIYINSIKNYYDRPYRNKGHYDVEMNVSVSRPYIGPFHVSNEFEIYLPLSTQYINKKKNIEKVDSELGIVIRNKENKPRGYINLKKMVLVPKNSNYVSKRPVPMRDVDRIFLTKDNNYKLLEDMVPRAFELLCNDLEDNDKFCEWVKYVKNPSLPWPPKYKDNQRKHSTNYKKGNNLLYGGVFFIVFVLVIIIIFVVCLSIK